MPSVVHRGGGSRDSIGPSASLSRPAARGRPSGIPRPPAGLGWLGRRSGRGGEVGGGRPLLAEAERLGRRRRPAHGGRRRPARPCRARGPAPARRPRRADHRPQGSGLSRRPGVARLGSPGRHLAARSFGAGLLARSGRGGILAGQGPGDRRRAQGIGASGQGADGCPRGHVGPGVRRHGGGQGE